MALMSRLRQQRVVGASSTEMASTVRAFFTRKRVVGLAIFAVLLAVFLTFNRAPKLDEVRADLVAATAPAARCFQGFCVESDRDAGLLSRWWEFSLAYLQLVSVGHDLRVPSGRTGRSVSAAEGRPPWESPVRGCVGIVKGFFIGAPMTLCSACIVPVSAAFRRRGAGLGETIAIVQASSTLNVPAVVMTALVFSPLVAGSRIALSLLGVLLIGPVVVWTVGRRRLLPESAATTEAVTSEPAAWSEVISEGLKDWALASFRYLVRLGPIMVIAGFFERAGDPVHQSGGGFLLFGRRSDGGGDCRHPGDSHQRTADVRDSVGGGAAADRHGDGAGGGASLHRRGRRADHFSGDFPR